MKNALAQVRKRLKRKDWTCCCYKNKLLPPQIGYTGSATISKAQERTKLTTTVQPIYMYKKRSSKNERQKHTSRNATRTKERRERPWCACMLLTLLLYHLCATCQKVMVKSQHTVIKQVTRIVHVKHHRTGEFMWISNTTVGLQNQFEGKNLSEPHPRTQARCSACCAAPAWTSSRGCRWHRVQLHNVESWKITVTV